MSHTPRIEDFIKEDDFLHITLINQEQPIVVPVHKYMQWATKNSKLDFQFDEIYKGDPITQSGTMGAEQYWTMDYRIIKEDILQYITVKQLQQII
jgi:hypothetical protein